MNDFTYHVATARADRPVTGNDTCITTIPPAMFLDFGDGPVLMVSLAAPYLRMVSDWGAQRCGEELHHADWIITGDPAIVEEKGMHDPGCPECREQVDRALAHLLAHPDDELFVGTLYWAGR